MKPSRGLVLGPILGYLQRLRFPWLFALTAILFLFDLVVPDVVPFADEVLLGLLATLLGLLRRHRDRSKPALEPVQEHDSPPEPPSRGPI